MRKILYSIVFIIILGVSISAYASNQGTYSNGSSMYSNGSVEFYSNIDDEGKLYKIDLSDMSEEKVLDEHVISMVSKDKYLYLLIDADNKSNLLKFNIENYSFSIEKEFDTFITNMAIRDNILYYLEEERVFAYNVDTNDVDIIIEDENIDFIYFTEFNTLKYLIKNNSGYDTKIYNFNDSISELNEVPLFPSQSDNQLSLMSVSSYSPRLSEPSTTNSYYIHTSYGGLNECIHISGGSVLPNCVGYAWGRSYENLGSRPNLSKGDAGTWYDYNKNNGYYSYGKNPYLGAVAVWKKTGGSGHVAVVEVIDGDVVITSESGYNSSRWWKTTRSASNSNFSQSSPYTFQGYIYVCGYLTDTAPTKATLTINKTDFKIGEAFTLNLSSNASCQYYMSIFDADSGDRILGENVSGTYKNSFQKAGHYTAYMSAFNSKGSVDSNWVDFYVFGDPPTSATLSANITELNLGDTVTLTTKTNAYYAKIYISIRNSAGKVIYSGNIPYSFKYKPSSVGAYSAHISAYTHEGTVDSNHINFYVGKYNVTFNANSGIGAPSAQKKVYGKTLTLSKTKPTRKGYTFKNWNTKANGSGTSYSAGSSYTANAAATLYAQWTANSYKVTFNANGGTTPTSSKNVTYNSTYSTLPTPSRAGYSFKGWHTAENGGTEITSNSKVTITSAQTLYAQWEKAADPTTEPTPTVEPTPLPEVCFTVDMQDLSADVTNTGEEQTVTVIIAEYDGDMLKSVKVEEITFAENEKHTFTLGEGTYKVFVWNSLSGMVPMTK